MITDRKIEAVKRRYPPGTRIQLHHMSDPYAPIESGMRGTVTAVDDIGDLLMKWDNGRTLALIPGEDSFSILPPKPIPLTMLKLYMPITADTFEQDQWGDYIGEAIELSPSETATHVDCIQATLQHAQSALQSTGLMDRCHAQDGVKEKVRHLVFTAEVRDDQLWGAAECQLSAPLTDEELDTLKDFITEQASVGFGAWFAQNGVLTADGQEIFVHLWQSGPDWDVETEQERFGSEELTFREQTF